MTRYNVDGLGEVAVRLHDCCDDLIEVVMPTGVVIASACPMVERGDIWVDFGGFSGVSVFMRIPKPHDEPDVVQPRSFLAMNGPRIWTIRISFAEHRPIALESLPQDQIPSGAEIFYR